MLYTQNKSINFHGYVDIKACIKGNLSLIAYKFIIQTFMVISFKQKHPIVIYIRPDNNLLLCLVNGDLSWKYNCKDMIIEAMQHDLYFIAVDPTI